MSINRLKRRSVRLKGYDYSQVAAYFVTVCTGEKKSLLGSVRDGGVELSRIGDTVRRFWEEIPEHFQNLKLDESVVMPNHVHGIIVLTGDRKSVYEHSRRGLQLKPGRGVQLNARTDTHARYSDMSPRNNTLSVIVRTFKGAVTNWCRTNGFEGFSWQRNFYDHIVRNHRSLESIREYIYYNPLKWHLDGQNPNRTGTDGFEEWLNGEKDEAWAFN